jgi:ribonucleotide monophosphatase NagD (HAD superfamily)
MIGDRLDTDIAGASNASLTTILVLSGIATGEDVSAASDRPDLVCADIQELLRRWKELTQ